MASSPSSILSSANIKCLRIRYLPFRAMAETTRFILEYASIPYEDEAVWGAYFSSQRAADKFPFDKVPVMEVEYTNNKPSLTIAQSGSIARFAARLAGLYETIPNDPAWTAYNDSIFEIGQEMCSINPILNCYSGSQFQKMLNWYLGENFPTNMSFLERQMKEMVVPRFQVSEGSSSSEKNIFFGGVGTPSFADFNIFHHVDNAETCVKGLLDEYEKKGEKWPYMRAWMGRMRRLEGLAKYLEKRPKVIEGDIGKDPGLVDRDGVVTKQRIGEGRCWINREGMFRE